MYRFLCYTVLFDKLFNKTTEGTEEKWSDWAGGLIRQLKNSAIFPTGALKSGLNFEGGRNMQGSS